MKRNRTAGFWPAAAQSLLGFIALALLTFVCSRLGLNLATTAFAYLILMVLLSLMGGSFIPLVALSIIAVGCLNYFFAAPIFDIRAEYPQELAMVGAFLITTLVVTGLVRRARGLAQTALSSQKTLGEQASLLDLTHDTVFVRDMNDVITYWNRGAEERYGWTRQEAVGKVSHQLTQTIFPAPLEEINAELLRVGRWEGELIHTRRDGTPVVVASRWALQRDEARKPVAILETNNDITERKRAEEALRESEEQWKAVFEHNPTMYFMVDAADAILSVNAFGAEQLGFTVNELVGRPMLSVVAETDREGVQRKVANCFEQPGQTMRWETRKVRKDGTLLWVRETAKAMMIKKRSVALLVCEDITERKRVEEAQWAQQREHEAMQRQLQQAAKMEAIGRLAGGIAHDFNNILGAILGYGELAQKDLAEGGAVRRYIDQVMQAGTRGKGLVERILAFSRSGFGERVPVHVQSVVEETLDLLAASLPPQVRLEKDLDAGDAAVVGEATQLHQVVMNLATNAVQVMAHGGVLRVALDRVALPERRLLSHGTLSPGVYVCLTVSDTGSGIPPEVLERVFEPFFTTKGAHKGTGLGLAQVHGIVADFGGAIDVATRAGIGTTFAIWLPAAGDTARPAPEVACELPRGNGETLMIVDDERALVVLAEETLAELGYEPAGFDSSVAALRAFRAAPQRFDLVLTDETMPELSGTELARELRRLRHELPIVLMSGHSDAQLVDRAHAAGVGEVLRKPLVRRDIAEALARALHPARELID